MFSNTSFFLQFIAFFLAHLKDFAEQDEFAAHGDIQLALGSNELLPPAHDRLGRASFRSTFARFVVTTFILTIIDIGVLVKRLLSCLGLLTIQSLLVQLERPRVSVYTS